MAIENDFLPFAVGSSANVLSQSAYAALTSLLQNGFQSGIANSQQLNKVWRQSSIMAAVMAQFIVAETGQTAIDDGTTATLLANFTTAVAAAARSRIILTDTGSANAYTAANPSPLTALPTSTGLFQSVSIANANTGASTYAPDGLAAKPIYGLGLQPLQGGELVAKGIATMLYVVASTVNSGLGAWVLLECTGGAQQIAPATAPQHAVQLGQVQTQAATAFTTGGTAPAYTLTPSPSITAYAANQRFRVSFNAAGTFGSNTLAVSGLAAKNLMVRGPGGALLPAVINSPMLSDVEYDGTQFIVLEPSARQVLSANLTVYVATTGSDTTNTGLSSGSPFATIQKAYNYVQQNYDLNGFVVTIQVANGTYTAGLTAAGPLVGALGVTNCVVQGNTGSPSSVVINVGNSVNCFAATRGGQFTVQGFTVQGGTASNGVYTNDNLSQINVNTGIVFGSMPSGSHLNANAGTINVLANYSITGGSSLHAIASNPGSIVNIASGLTVTITGTPAFSTAFVDAGYLGMVTASSVTWSGSATGSRYGATANGVVNSGGAGATYFPGNAAGSTATGGQYI
jgi:hypothetical protein